MKRNIILLLIITVLGIAAYYALSTKNSTLHKKDNKFQIEDPHSLLTIVIQSSDDTSRLENKNGKWIVNNEPADQKRVQDLLTIIGLLDVVSPVSGNLKDSVDKVLLHGTEIIFNDGNIRVRKYAFGNWVSNIYARQSGSKNAYRITVKGYPGIDLTKILSPRPADWQENVLMNFKPEEIKGIALLYSDLKEKSFIISNETEKVKVLNYKLQELSNIDEMSVNEYLSFYSLIYFMPLPDSVQTNNMPNPFFELKLLLKNSENLNIKGYKITDPSTGKNDPFVFVAHSSNDGFILLNYNDLDPILVSKDYFLKK